MFLYVIFFSLIIMPVSTHFLNCAGLSFIVKNFAQMDGYVYQSTKSRRGSTNLIKRLDSVFPSLGMPRREWVMAFCGAIDAVSAVNLLVVSDDTRHIQCMYVCLRLVPQSACLCDTIYDWIYEEERVRLKKNYQRTAIFRISKRLYHWRAHIPHK